jgi:hypothetical protein
MSSSVVWVRYCTKLTTRDHQDSRLLWKDRLLYTYEILPNEAIMLYCCHVVMPSMPGCWHVSMIASSGSHVSAAWPSAEVFPVLPWRGLLGDLGLGASRNITPSLALLRPRIQNPGASQVVIPFPFLLSHG